MQKEFEFDAPRYCCLTTLPDKRNTSDYRLDQNDSSDFWFMHSHVPPESIQHAGRVDVLINLQVPLVRKSVADEKQVSSQVIQGKQQSQNNVNIIETQPQEKKQQVHKNIFNKQEKKTFTRQSSKIIAKKVSTSREIKFDDGQPKSAEKKVSFQKKNQIVTRSRSIQLKTNIKQIRPCPFPPRIERQWEQMYKKRWYSLSPTEKIEAEQQMEKILQNQTKKQRNDKYDKTDKLKKNVRFKF